jgi:hypothetical protein
LGKTVGELVVDMENLQNWLTQYISLMLFTGYGFQNSNAVGAPNATSATTNAAPSVTRINSWTAAHGYHN